MAQQTAAQRKRRQRARDRARLGDAEYKRIERDKMRAYRARKNPKPAQPQPVQQPPAQPAQQPQPIKPSKKNQKKQKAAQQLIRAPVQVVKDYIPLYKKPNAQPISDSSIRSYLNQFKKVYEHFTKKDVPVKLNNELTKVLQLKQYDHVYVTKHFDFLKDTIKFIDELKLRYPNKNSNKT